MELIQHDSVVFITLAVVFGAYLCWVIGANDVANAMGSPVGSGSLSVRNALIIAMVCEFLGAFLAGHHVTVTIGQEIVDPTPYLPAPHLLVYGMLAVLLASAIWLMLATIRGWPVSTSHAIVGAIVGFSLVSHGMEGVQWGVMGVIVSSWLLAPLMGGVIAYLLTISIRTLILNQADPFAAARNHAPLYLFVMGWFMALCSLWGGIPHLDLEFSPWENLLIAMAVGGALALGGWWLVRGIRMDPQADRRFLFASVEQVFVPLLIFAAAGMSYAHGSNDVANGIGPLTAVLALVETGDPAGAGGIVPAWVLALGGGGIALGLITYGYQIMKTIGHKITELTPSRAFSTTMAAALTVVVASRLGLPVSTSHVAVGAVMGVGLARGVGALDLRVLGGIIVSWLLTLPVAGVVAMLIFFILKGMFG